MLIRARAGSLPTLSTSPVVGSNLSDEKRGQFWKRTILQLIQKPHSAALPGNLAAAFIPVRCAHTRAHTRAPTADSLQPRSESRARPRCPAAMVCFQQLSGGRSAAAQPMSRRIPPQLLCLHHTRPIAADTRAAHCLSTQAGAGPPIALVQVNRLNFQPEKRGGRKKNCSSVDLRRKNHGKHQDTEKVKRHTNT